MSSGVMVWNKETEYVEIQVSVVGLEGVGKTTLLSQMEGKQRRFESRSDFRRDYILDAVCSPEKAESEEKVKFVFKEIDMKRLKSHPLQGLFRDEIVIMVYNDRDKKSYYNGLNLARGIKTVFPDTIFFFLGNKALKNAKTLVEECEITEDVGLEDSVKLHLRAKSFRSQEFLDAFLPKFLQISYYKSCQDRGLPANQPETVAVAANYPLLLSSSAMRCSIL